MAIDRVTERSDGVTTERVVEQSTPTMVAAAPAERRGGGAGILYALIGLALVALVAFFLLNMNRQETARTEAVSDAASSVAGSVDNAAEAVGDAAGRAADAVTPSSN